MENEIKHYNYKRKYLTKDGSIKEFNQSQSYITAESHKEDDLQHYITDTIKTASLKVRELKRIDKIINSILQYRGYNQKNLNQRIFKLEKANEIKMEDKKLLRDIMGRQKLIAGDLTELLKFILQLYDVHDSEIKELTNQLKEFDKT